MEAAVTFYDEYGFPSDMPVMIDVSAAFDRAFAYAVDTLDENIFYGVTYRLAEPILHIVRPHHAQSTAGWSPRELAFRYHVTMSGESFETINIRLIPSRREMARLIDAEYARLHPAGVLTRFFNWLTKVA